MNIILKKHLNEFYSQLHFVCNSGFKLIITLYLTFSSITVAYPSAAVSDIYFFNLGVRSLEEFWRQ